MATYAREHPLQSIIAIAAALTMLALGLYVATADAGSGGQAATDDHGAMILLRDDPAGDDHGGATRANDDPAGHDSSDDHGGATRANDGPAGHDAGDDHGGNR
jgi:hypothetical protein